MALNLTVASRIFLMDPWWNPAAEYQAIDRAHRLGQHKPIRAVRLVMRSYLLLLTTHHSPLTTHHSRLPTHCLRLTTHYLLQVRFVVRNTVEERILRLQVGSKEVGSRK